MKKQINIKTRPQTLEEKNFSACHGCIFERTDCSVIGCDLRSSGLVWEIEGEEIITDQLAPIRAVYDAINKNPEICHINNLIGQLRQYRSGAAECSILALEAIKKAVEG